MAPRATPRTLAPPRGSAWLSRGTDGGHGTFVRASAVEPGGQSFDMIVLVMG